MAGLGGEPVQSLGYAYDAKVNLSARTDSMLGKTEELEHDALDRLTCSRFPWAKSDECAEEWHYDDAGNITWTSALGPSSRAANTRPDTDRRGTRATLSAAR